MPEAALLERAAATAQVFVDDLESLELTRDDAHHLFAVRRVRVGESVVVADGAGAWRMAVASGGGLEASGSITLEPEPTRQLTVGLTPVKGDRSDWAVTKLTELGCDRIVALQTDHSVVRWSPAAAERALARWRRLAREACCQCRRVRLPAFEGPLSLAAFDGAEVALAVPGAGALPEVTTTVLVGPEGGWSQAERARGLREVGLGSQILRSETAAVAAGVLLGALRAGTVAAMERGASQP
jgi:16S rRNA (uracil1498-N3)-methyltransferase